LCVCVCVRVYIYIDCIYIYCIYIIVVCVVLVLVCVCIKCTHTHIHIQHTQTCYPRAYRILAGADPSKGIALIHVHVHVHLYVNVCVCECVCAHTSVYVHTHTHTHLHYKLRFTLVTTLRPLALTCIWTPCTPSLSRRTHSCRFSEVPLKCAGMRLMSHYTPDMFHIHTNVVHTPTITQRAGSAKCVG